MHRLFNMKESLNQEENSSVSLFGPFTDRNDSFCYPFIHVLQLTKPLTIQSLKRYLSLAKPPRIYAAEGQMESQNQLTPTSDWYVLLPIIPVLQPDLSELQYRYYREKYIPITCGS